MFNLNNPPFHVTTNKTETRKWRQKEHQRWLQHNDDQGEVSPGAEESQGGKEKSVNAVPEVEVSPFQPLALPAELSWTIDAVEGKPSQGGALVDNFSFGSRCGK